MFKKLQTISQLGMRIRVFRNKEGKWKHKVLISGLGAL